MTHGFRFRLARVASQYGLVAAVAILLTMNLLAQRGGGGGGFGGFGGGGFGGGSRASEVQSDFPKSADFHFVRMEYFDYMRRGFGNVSRRGQASGWWAQDWPDADEHFTAGIQRLTRIDVGEPVHLALTDERLFDYPWMYATQVGYWTLSDAETKKLREYLDRGGFLMTDDFWGPGPDEWNVFQEAMDRALPNHPITDITMKESVMHVLYDIEEKDLTFIPGTRHLYRGQPAGTQPAWKGIYDDRQRLIVAVNYNTDIGDAWEYADAPEYPEKMTSLAYRYGINYLMYAITH
jgi:Domain of unknown function (DUF4159)